MWIRFLFFITCTFLQFTSLAIAEKISYSPIFISSPDAEKIARKIWRNECGGTVTGLTTWNQGEDFASLGIGHFIWYPKNKMGPFREMFPDLILFLVSRGVALPQWLRDDKSCPWSTREEFLQMQDSLKMNELRQLLKETIALQAEFMALRLQRSLPSMMMKFPESKRKLILMHFNNLVNEPMGLYAILDYLNFKGEGLLPTEEYQGEGWGLVQVLELMKESNDGRDIVTRFAEAAKFVLERRVANSPIERNEKRWLKGWLNRLETYKN